MFSSLATAAKGFFTRQDADDVLADRTTASSANTSAMVVATRKGTVASREKENLASNDASQQGKRKAQPVATEKTEDKQSKRRKRNAQELEDESAEDTASERSDEPFMNGGEAEPKKHFRFGSEDAEPSTTATQLEPISSQGDQDDDDSDSDDDAPEAFDNAAALLRIKEQARKQEKAKQQEDQLRKDRRRKLDEIRKLQAKSKPTERTASSEDLLSESTTTLLGDNTEDARRRALPALLPDDILNAEPVARPPTPPADNFGFAIPRRSNKLRFLEKSEKPPKDLQVGDVTIRVLDAPATKQSSKPALPPKASKSGRGTREGWLKQEKSTAHVNGLRRTAGGSTGFKRR
ncbi:hypothetical protein N7539_005912 [Penicillium diatomitis]|uniref:Immediate-early protein n=1 Tax=Penicillium diatomitis TaxID=2819901 RepID=A0A9W9X5G8_9EURO|nr:uncharacterized protein N7539_005912 [Penicillium diatomitis]KAJ5484116.1 hypothetical protein N7539_005912 [Penicillium diatomitis]